MVSSNAYRSDIIPFDLPVNKPAVDGAGITLYAQPAGCSVWPKTELANAVRRYAGATGRNRDRDGKVKTGANLAMASSPGRGLERLL